MEKKKTLEGIDSIIRYLQSAHRELSIRWIQLAERKKIHVFNQSKLRVTEAVDDEDCRESMTEYLAFMNSSAARIFPREIDYPFDIDYRVKAVNSIEDKFEDYCEYRPEKGKVSFNKCFNDLFGARAIIDCDEITYENISRRITDLQGIDVK